MIQQFFLSHDVVPRGLAHETHHDAVNGWWNKKIRIISKPSSYNKQNYNCADGL